MIATELKDPRIGFATVTRIELSPDLHQARIMVSVLGDELVKRETLAGLLSATGYIRHEIAHRLRLRRVPEVSFVFDCGPAEASRIEEMLQKLKIGGT